MDLRPYQANAVAFLRDRRRGFIQAPAGAGKTFIAAAALAEATKRGAKNLGWIANTKDQVDQGIAAVSAVEGPADVEFEFWCAAAQPDVSHLDALVGDELHHFGAETWANTFAKVKPGCRVFGFSATPWSDPLRDAALLEYFGGRENFFVIELEEVKASGHLAEGAVIFHDLDALGEFDAQIEAQAAPEIRRRIAFMPYLPQPPNARAGWTVAGEHRQRVLWQYTQACIQANATRNAAAVMLARTEAARGISGLILVSSIEHGEHICEAVGPDARMVHSKSKTRKKDVQDFRAGVYRVMVATSLADEGLDVPVASFLILLSGGRSATKIIQRAGRVMRPYLGKTHGTVHDFSDRGAKLAAAQASARRRVYQSLGYSVQTVSL